MYVLQIARLVTLRTDLVKAGAGQVAYSSHLYKDDHSQLACMLLPSHTSKTVEGRSSVCCLAIWAAAASSSSGKETNLSLTLGPAAGYKNKTSLW